jgi:hypothetical protein
MALRFTVRHIIPSVLLYLALLASAVFVDYVLHALELAWVGRYCGIVGTALLLISFLYSLRKRKLMQASGLRRFSYSLMSCSAGSERSYSSSTGRPLLRPDSVARHARDARRGCERPDRRCFSRMQGSSPQPGRGTEDQGSLARRDREGPPGSLTAGRHDEAMAKGAHAADHGVPLRSRCFTSPSRCFFWRW